MQRSLWADLNPSITTILCESKKVYCSFKSSIALAIIILFSYYASFAQKQGQARIDSISKYLENITRNIIC